MRREVYEVRVVDSLGYVVATVPVFGTVDAIISNKEQIISYILHILSQVQEDVLFLDKVQENEDVFFELYDMSGEFITMLN